MKTVFAISTLTVAFLLMGYLGSVAAAKGNVLMFNAVVCADNEPTHVVGAARSVQSEKKKLGKTQKGKASYYADKFQGRKTASGQPYDKALFTAAHPKLPFGSVVRVTSLRDPQKSVEVRINDRGPYSKKRIIDLSRAAAEKLDMIRAGILEVEVEVLSLGGEK